MGQLKDEVLEAFSDIFKISIDEVKEVALIDWAARVAAEFFVSSSVQYSEVTPFIFNDDESIISGDELENILYNEYCREVLEMVKDNLMNKNVNKNRKEFH